MTIYVGDKALAGLPDLVNKANTSLNNLTAEGESHFDSYYAKTSLNNLNNEGHAKLQYTPFSVNNGRVTSTGNNGTLYVPEESQIYIDVPFEQPTLSANGTLGGDEFAVSGCRNSLAWQAFDNNNSTSADIRYDGSYPLIFYNPEPITLSQIVFYWNDPGGYWASGTNGILSGSNDGSTWTTVQFGFGGHNSDGTLTVDISNFNYTYGKIEFPSATSYNVARVNSIELIGTVRKQVSSSSILICDPCTITTCDGRTKEFNEPAIYTTSSTPVIVEKDWTQPILTENGTLGQGVFSVYANEHYGTFDAWKAFDKSSSFWAAAAGNPEGAYIDMYTEKPIKISKITITNDNVYCLTGGIIYGGTSTDDYQQLCTFTNSNTSTGANWDINVNSTGFYQYHRLYVTSGRYASSAVMRLREIQLIATYQVTQADADGTYKVFKNIDTGKLSLHNNFKISKTVPLNGSIIGTLTNDNGILSGFSSGNLFELPSSLSSAVSSGQSWELVICYTVFSSSQGNIFIDGVTDSSATVNGIAIVKDSGSDVVSFILTKTAGSIVQNISHPVTPGIKTWTKVVFDGSKYVTSYSTDGHSFTQAGTYTSSVTISSDTSHTYLGCNIFNNGYYNPFTNGEIDIKECYINVNDSLWWSGAYVAYLNPSTTPPKLYIEGQRNDNFVYMGDVTINTGAITNITNVEYNMLRAELLKQPLSGIGMPSDKYIDLTLGASGSTYTAPANGYYYIAKNASATNQYVQLSSGLMSALGDAYVNSQTRATFLPVKVGQTITATYTTGGALQAFRFIYAEGELHQ